jgi:transglutaminase-like putative cysteine protease
VKRLLLFVAALLALSGCCNLVEVEPPPEQRRRPRPIDPAPQPTDVDLGLGAFPRGANGAAPTRYRFEVRPLEPKIYRAAYALAEAEHKEVRAEYVRWARSVGFEKIDRDRFRWHPPEGCGSDLRCVFDEAARRDAPDLAPLADLFRARSRDAHLNTLQAAELVVGFVQAIQYEVPDEPFGLLPPALVAAERRGDCDSKSLLALILLRALGIDAVMLESEAHHHAMLGVNLPAPGASMEVQGRRYAFTECTAVGWPIGQIDPRLLHPNDWHASKVHFSRSAEPKRKLH